MNHQERLEREFAPSITHLREIETQIAHYQSEIAALEEIHSKLLKIARVVDPETWKPKPKEKIRLREIAPVSETTLQEAIVYLRNNYEPDEDFYTTLLDEEPSWEPSKSHTQKILSALHARGQIRLASTGRGRRRNYRVVV